MHICIYTVTENTYIGIPVSCTNTHRVKEVLKIGEEMGQGRRVAGEEAEGAQISRYMNLQQVYKLIKIPSNITISDDYTISLCPYFSF